MDKLKRELFSPKGERTLLKSKEFIRKYLWARERIPRLSDYGRVGANIAEEVKNLGLQYHLMTQYPSFVAVELELVFV